MVEEKKITKDENVEKEIKKVEKPEEKKAVKKTAVKKKVIEIKPKDKAIVRALGVRASPKYSFAICKMIKGKSLDRALEDLELVLRKKKVVRMHSAEVGHKPGKRTAGGRYPMNATRIFIDVIKQLKANSNVCGIENPIIVIAKADKASEPYRREGRRGKRAHIYLEARDKNKLNKKKK